MNPYEYLDYVAGRWRVIAVACVVAGVLALGVSLTRTRQYTAVARVLIEPPAGGDVRASVAVSPIYLESLRTYEHFASSDTLFREALDRFGLREKEPGRTIESWKSRVLDVSIPNNTRILEIGVTLPDPATAQQMAQFLAERTVTLARTVTEETDVEMAREAEQRLTDAQAELDRIEKSWVQLLGEGAPDQIQEEIETLMARQYRQQRSLDDAEVRLAERGDSNDLAARVRESRRQLRETEAEIERMKALLARRVSRSEELDSERQRAQSAYEAAADRAREARTAVGMRGERLRIVDPGVAPERPSSRGVFIVVLAAMVLALVGSAGYLTLRFGYLSGRGQFASRDD